MTRTLTKEYQLQFLHLVDNTLHAGLLLPENLIYFNGHFDGFPILPGVVQTHWAIELAEKHLPVQGNFSSIDVIKFTQIITPSSIIKLDIDYSPDKNCIDFKYRSDKGSHSSGRITFG